MKSFECELCMEWYGMLLCFFNFVFVIIGFLWVDVLKNICVVLVLYGSYVFCYCFNNYCLFWNLIIFFIKKKIYYK